MYIYIYIYIYTHTHTHTHTYIHIHTQNCFSFQCVPIVQNQSYASVLRLSYKINNRICVAGTNTDVQPQQREADERALFAGITSTEFMSPIRHFPICIPVRSVPAGLRLLPCPLVLEAAHTVFSSIRGGTPTRPILRKKNVTSHTCQALIVRDPF
jgi:hypothetical protein